MVEALVEHDYKAQEPDELTIKKGDLIVDIEIKPGGWWEGTLSRGGKRGMFPDNFVKLLGDSKPTQETKTDVTLRSNPGRKCKALFSYKPLNDDELELQIGDIIDVLGEEEEGWWRGKLKNQIGVFPSNFVTEMENTEVRETAARKPKVSQDESAKQSAPSPASASEVNNVQHSPSSTTVNSEPHDAPILPPKPISGKEMCKVLFPYEALNDDELTFNEGDMITLITKEGQDVGWWKGELRGKIGVFPDNFVHLITPDEAIKPDRPAKSITSNKLRESTSKTSINSTTTVTTASAASRKFNDLSKPPDEKASPPSVSKKPSLPPPPHKKPLRSPSTNELTKSSTSPSLSSKQQQQQPPESPTSVISRIPMSNYSSAMKHMSSSTVETITTSSSNKWTVIENETTDGGFMSRQSYSITSGGSSTTGLNVNSTIATNSELDLDLVGRAAMLTHLTASRAKAPGRRLPSGMNSKHDIKEESDASEGLMNGNAEIPAEKAASKAPWVEELKLNQAKKSLQVGRTRVHIGPPQTDAVVSSEIPPTKPSSVAGFILRSMPVVGQRPHSMFSTSKPTPIPPEENSIISTKQWNELFEKVTRMETHFESRIDTLMKTIKELTDKLDEERERRMHMQQEIEKLTDLVTQV